MRLRIETVSPTGGSGVWITGILLGQVAPGQEAEVVGARTLRTRVLSYAEAGQERRTKMLLEGLSPSDLEPGWIVATPGALQPVHRVRLEGHLLSYPAQQLHREVALYNAHEPDLARRVEAWRLGTQLLSRRNPHDELRKAMGPVPAVERLGEPADTQIQLWRDDLVLRATLSSPPDLGEGVIPLEATLEVSTPLEPGEVFFWVAGWGPGAPVIGQVTVRSVLQSAAKVEIAPPAVPPPMDGPLAPGDLQDAWSVWADRLMDEGDPRGELIALQAAGKDASPLLHAHREALLGPFAPERAPHVQLDWQLGYWRRATVHWTQALGKTGALGELAAALLSHPSARVLHTLDLRNAQRGQQATATWRELASTLSREGPLPLRELSLTSTAQSGSRELSGRCALGPLWPALPELEQLRVTCRELDLGNVHAPRLLRVCLEVDLVAGAVRQLCASRVPLQELEISISQGIAVSLESLLQRPLPGLRSLRLFGCTSLREVIELLAASPLLPQLQRLSVRPLPMYRSVTQPELLPFLPWFSHLQDLHLEGFSIYNRTDELQRTVPALRITP